MGGVPAKQRSHELCQGNVRQFLDALRSLDLGLDSFRGSVGFGFWSFPRPSWRMGGHAASSERARDYWRRTDHGFRAHGQ